MKPTREAVRWPVLGAAVALICAGASAENARDVTSPRVLVGPNILVSRDGDVPHVELMIAASPRTARHLLGAAVTATRPSGGMACRAYSSTDGGSTWKSTEFPEQIEFGGLDPQVAFTARGTALMAALTFNQSEEGRTCGTLHLWRSEDAGRNWLPAIEIPCSPSWDHPQIAVDHTRGRFAGRIYIGVLYGYPVYRVGIFRSDDDGRTWTGPVEAANGGGKIGINVVNVMVLADGTLVVPYVDFDFLPEKQKSKGRVHMGMWFVTSPDGGITFSAPRKIENIEVNLDDPDFRTSTGVPAFASGGPETNDSNRMYAAWPDYRLGRPRILFSRSSDRGRTWSGPRALDGTIPPEARQWQPVVAVNRDGVVAVTWYDTRHSQDGSQFDEYFSASVDRGESFLPPVRISSASSNPRGPGNSRITPSVFSGADGLHLSFLSAASRWGSGGDYMGLTADREGAFHPFWADSRTGTFQIYTARVRVQLPEKKETATGGKGGSAPSGSGPAPAPEQTRVEAPLTGRIEVAFDPTRFDADSGELEVPLRLKNVSKEPIYPPMRLEVTGVGLPEYESEDDKKENAENAPRAVNSSNGKEGVGAVFHLENVLGNLEALEPGAQSGPFVLRFRLVDSLKTPSLRITVTGHVRQTR